ncbi:flagella basal body P-ring formation protein FlgA [Selenomonas ruminantium]|uniref:Flagella basal body P-ring formation protein FlgA n=1 Tax=Selenomonas ruminantium TaxID=971 RepID=A0A1M6TC72_SELRU|nr:flagellar basal body P-ring formation chaperone FlgA [Selenomonas ruminantium]SHK54368.1 flagella basal body P-ring formation protein FlgA [Selenomonas ruminantium]
MKVKRTRLASLFTSWMLWIGFFCLLFCVSLPQAEALYGGRQQAEAFPQMMSSQKLSGIARQQVELELHKIGEKRRYVLTLTTSPPDMRLPAGKIRYEAELPGKLRYGNVQPVHIRVYINEKLYRRTICYYRVQVFEKVLVAGSNLPLEQGISEKAVRLEEREVFGGAGRYLTKYEDIAGRVPVRYIHMGQPLEQNMLQNPVVINTGSPVKLVTSYHGVQVKAEGVALQKGRVGGSIRVRNARSGKMLVGKVVDAETVEIAGQ